MTTSQAAITITTRAKIWPSWLPSMRLNATSARLPAFSISSRQSRITTGLRRISTPPAPTAKRSAERTRYHSTFNGNLPGLVRLPLPLGQDDRPHRRQEQQQRGRLEGDQEALQQQPADR